MQFFSRTCKDIPKRMCISGVRDNADATLALSETALCQIRTFAKNSALFQTALSKLILGSSAKSALALSQDTLDKINTKNSVLCQPLLMRLLFQIFFCIRNQKKKKNFGYESGFHIGTIREKTQAENLALLPLKKVHFREICCLVWLKELI
jgi:hypothetical protein